MSEGPILHLYKYGRKTELHTDACKQGFGAILLQEAEDGKLHPVYYMSKKTNTAEENSPKLSLDDSTKWYKYVDRLQRILNSTICRSTKWTPFELLVGIKNAYQGRHPNKDLLLEEMAKEQLEQREFF
ncbi:retrovirus-related Pol polyprotein from transposon 17.6 [Trichonephila clavipes]|nr:retrovirus-related Pol polyprotein from transposon 17.6 [Trichonephila clavipes]